MKAKQARKLLRRCCQTTIRAINSTGKKTERKEDNAYIRAFESMTGRKPRQRELDSIFRTSEEG